MVNESLCKILCHNLVVLIHEMHELGTDPGILGCRMLIHKFHIAVVLAVSFITAHLFGTNH